MDRKTDTKLLVSNAFRCKAMACTVPDSVAAGPVQFEEEHLALCNSEGCTVYILCVMLRLKILHSVNIAQVDHSLGIQCNESIICNPEGPLPGDN